MPLYHTMGVRSLLAMAAINGCFVCLPRFDASEALALIARERVSALYLVPTLYHDLLAYPGFPGTDISSVTKLGYAGATMTDGLLARLDKAFKPDLFVNHYGSSEIYTFTVEQDAASKPGSAGKAGLNQEIRVIALDTADPDDVVAPGTEGQIAARLDGDESFAGYWRRPDADKKALRRGWYLTAFVTGTVDAKTLDEFCRASDLANFKRPRDYVFVTAIPKSPVGKILRRLLVAGDYEKAKGKSQT